jgi:uncharacterized protein YjiS (DUF1127 family)
MRDYALHRAQSAESAGALPLLRQAIANWRARRAVAQLDRFDDFLLRDIGVTREEVRWAADLPLNLNATLALEERARRRRR